MPPPNVGGVTDTTPWPPVPAELPERHPDAPPPGTKLPMHYSGCFGCGDAHANGLRLQLWLGEGLTVHGEFTVTEAHQGAPGLAHGGVLTAAFDEALGATVGFLLRQPAVTGRLETDFRRPVPVGSTLHIKARHDGVTGRKVFVSAEGRLDAPDGPLAVQARALFIRVEFSHFTKHSGRGVVDPDQVDVNP